MNKPAGQVRVQVINEAQTVVPPGEGLAYIVGPTLKGLKGNAKTIITSVAHFIRTYGDDGGLFTAIAKRMIQQGAQLRVSRVVSSTAAYAESDPFYLGSLPVFKFKAKAPGYQYNNVSVELIPGEGNLFDIYVTELDSTGAVATLEKFLNLVVPENTTVNPWYLDPVRSSNLVEPIYLSDSGDGVDSSSGAGIWASQENALEGGSNGADLVTADYTAALAGFDPYYDGKVVCIPHLDGTEVGIDDAIINAALITYAEARKDLVCIVHVPNTMDTKDKIVEYMEDGNGISTSKFAIVTAGGVKAALLGGYISDLPETGFYAAMLVNHYNTHPWRSPSGYNYGIIAGTNGPVNNFGSPANFTDLDLITREGVNMFINRDGTHMFWTGYTMALDNTPEKFASIVLLEFYMISFLKPTLERFISEPNDPETWSRIYYTCKVILDRLVEFRALTEYQWDGDQFASSMNDLQVNDPQDVQDGIYKVQLQIKTVSPIVIIDLAIILTNAGVEFK